MENQFPSSNTADGVDNSTPGPGLALGQEVGDGRFVLKQQMGQGGMGVVWLAFDNELNEHVALKFLPPPIHSDFGSIEDLRMELKRNRGLTHPNIVKVYDLHTVKGEPAFFSMEYVDGPNLAKLRNDQSERVVSWEMLSPWVRQLCEALDYAHSEKIVHRDLKPGNLMVDSKGRIKLADFGIARIVTDSVSRVTGSQGTSGTLIYMSPQQLDGKHPRPTDDIYALGATLYELLTGKAPFYSGDVAHQIRSLQPESMERRLADLGLNNMIPTRVQQTVFACLAKDPVLRPQTAGLVAERLGLAILLPRYVPSASLSVSPSGVASQGPARFDAPKPRPQSEAPPAAESPIRTPAYSLEEGDQLSHVKPRPGRRSREVAMIMLLALVVMGGIFHGKFQTWIEIGSSKSDTTRTSMTSQLTDGVVIVRANPVNSKITVGDTHITNSLARFELSAGQFTLIVENPGYKTHMATITVEKNKTNVQVISLEPVASQAKRGGLVVTSANQASVNPDPQHLAWIPPGTFTMGSPSTEVDRYWDEGPQMVVTISQGFWMSKCETTQREYLAVMGSNPSHLTGDLQRPVEQVTWYDATNYCGKLTTRERVAGRLPGGYEYRLPTEAEWEYACRAGTETATAYGNNLSSSQANFNGGYPYNGGASGPNLNRTTKVGSYAPNAWGIYDMHGNVWEWCLDWFGTYPGGSATDPLGPALGSVRVRRGGCWIDRGRYCRSARRYNLEPPSQYNNVGFRPVIALAK